VPVDHHQPAKPEALIATAKAINAAKVSAPHRRECSTFTIEDKENAEQILRAAATPCSIAR
jgi:hypothetical protein